MHIRIYRIRRVSAVGKQEDVTCGRRSTAQRQQVRIYGESSSLELYNNWKKAQEVEKKDTQALKSENADIDERIISHYLKP
jgi:hypothetical protein